MLVRTPVLIARTLATLLAVSTTLVTSAEPQTPASKPQELVFLTWAEYMDPDVIAEFENRFNARVKFSYFEADDDRTDQLVRAQARGFDVVLSSGDTIRDYSTIGWLEPLGTEKIPNLKHHEKRWRTAFKNAETHGVPLFWGTLGIGYRQDLVQHPITSLRQLFQPDESLRGRILMVESARDAIGLGLMSLGYSPNSADLQQLDEVERLLSSQQPYVQDYAYVVMTEKSELITGEILVTTLYNGDAVYLQDMEPNIHYVIPDEGCLLWTDYLTVLRSSKHKELAYQFINFLSEPAIAARLSEYLGFATPNRQALSMLPKDFLDNPISFPDAETLSRCHYNEELPPRVMKKRNTIFSRITQIKSR